jgi:hypothetical protein
MFYLREVAAMLVFGFVLVTVLVMMFMRGVVRVLLSVLMLVPM